MSLAYPLLAFLPIILLFVISLWKGVRTGVYASFALTSLLFFFWGNPVVAYLASIFSALLGTINILMIIFGAVFLYQIMEQKGYIKGIKESLAEIHPDKGFRFFFLAFFLTSFFESVSGFGTPLAIVPLLLISIGFSPLLSISTVLLIDGLFSVAGAVGTPIQAGMEIPLGLASGTVNKIYLYATLLLLIAGLVLLYFIIRFYRQETSDQKQGKTGIIMYLSIMLPFFSISYFFKELSGLLASVFMAVFAYVFLFKNKKLLWKPWMPYWVLVGLLLIPKLFTEFADLISYKLEFLSIYGTDISASLQPFKSPLIPFLATALFVLYHSRSFTIDLKPVISKTVIVFLMLFPSLAITQLMINSGNELPSMLTMLANVFSKAGPFYVLVSPYIGILGAFISGSTTVSNIIFGPVQLTSSIQLNLPQDVLLAIQVAGASLGNAVCLFNIIAAAAVTGTKEYGLILKKNILPIMLAALICGLIGYVLI
ncbi:MAG TPA: L-lactate permease [Cytophagaceae bacterium]